MNHPFTKSQLDETICARCKRGPVAHTEFARCESCNARCKCDLVNNILLCPDCFEKELEVSSEPKVKETKEAYPNGAPEPIKRIEKERFPEINKFTVSEPLADLPQNGDEFFNAEVISHIELRKRIMADDSIEQSRKHYFYVEQLTLRQKRWQEVLLVEAIGVIKQLRSENAAMQRDINLAISGLRTEEREKLKLRDVNYVSPKPPLKVISPRMSPKERSIIDIAKLFHAPRKDGIIQWEALTAEEREIALNKARNQYQGTLSDIKSVDSVIDKKAE